MTDKQERILSSSLELFAMNGYNAVSTSKIAKHAGVSEGLIFRHFKNKQGLLDAILQQAFERATALFAHIIIEEDPKEVLYKAISLPFHVGESEYHFWKLQYKLKWELEISSKEKTQPLIDKLSWAFEKLGYKEPINEAIVLQHIIESITGSIIKDGLEPQLPLEKFLLTKYKV